MNLSNRIHTFGIICLVAWIPLTPVGAQQQATPAALVEQAERDLRRAVPVYDRNGLITAADLFRRALAGNPQFARAHLGLAESLLWLGELESAAVSVAAARRLRAPATATDLMEARVRVRQGDFAAAQQLYREILRREPYNRDALIGRAVLQSAGENLSERSLGSLRDLERRFPEDRLLLSALVEFSLLRGEEEAARRYLASALTYHSDIPSVQLVAARWALEAGDPGRAELHARNVVRLAPTMEEGWLLLARAALLQDKPGEARTHYEQLIVLDDGNYRAWYSRGVLAARTGDRAGAVLSWNEALRIRPDFEIARIAREGAFFDLPLQSPERETAALRYRILGAALEERFLNRQAERAYRRGLQLNPFDRVLRRQLADLYLRQGYRSRFVQELDLLLSLGEDSREVRELLESYRPTLRDLPATRWQVDQFTAPRPRTAVTLHYGQSITTLEPEIALGISDYLATYLNTSQNIVVAGIFEQKTVTTDSLADARRAGADRAVFLEVDHRDHSIRLDLVVADPATGTTILQRQILRSGVDSVTRAVRDVVVGITSVIVPQGVVLERRFERVLVSLGRVDGIEEDDLLEFTDQRRGVPLGSGRVVAVDDLVAEVVLNLERPDQLTVGAIVTPGREDAAATGDAPVPLESQIDVMPQNTLINQIVSYLFGLR